MANQFASQRLPIFHTNFFIRLVDRHSLFVLLLAGILIYSFCTFSATFIEVLIANSSDVLLNSNKESVTDFWEIVYFNFVTILTVGYGDYSPIGWGRLISILEALIGVGLFGTIIGIVILKLTNPDSRSLVFSRYCYYALDKNKFFIVYTNTNKSPLINVEKCSFLKIGGDWRERPSYSSPYIGDSVQTFFIDGISTNELRGVIVKPDDGLKFGIKGSYGFASFSTAIKYSLDDILVVESRVPFTRFQEFIHPKFYKPSLRNKFHYRPPDAITFNEYIRRLNQA